jgi:hypothetical protein
VIGKRQQTVNYIDIITVTSKIVIRKCSYTAVLKMHCEATNECHVAQTDQIFIAQITASDLKVCVLYFDVKCTK